MSADENAGLFTFLVGMIVLVMSAVGLSIVADKYTKRSKDTGDIKHQISANDSEISTMSSRLDEKSRLMVDAGAKRQSAAKAYKQISSEVESLRERQAALQDSKTRLDAAITVLESDFARYREDYRRKEWVSAVGEKLGTLTVRGGRGYQQAVITRVTDVGLEIRHSDGIARIQAPDLDPAFQDRFQWSDEERRQRLKQEREHHLAAGGQTEQEESVNPEMASEPRLPAPAARIAAKELVDAGKLAELRQQVIGWRMKVSTLSSERSQAASRIGYGSQSVPGSLETWSARASRLGRELSRAQSGLALAKAKLAEISPRDALLREPQNQY